MGFRSWMARLREVRFHRRIFDLVYRHHRIESARHFCSDSITNLWQVKRFPFAYSLADST